MTDKQRHERRMKEIEAEVQRYRYKQEEGEALAQIKPKHEKYWTASKIFLVIVFVICVEVIVFSEVFMFVNHDTSSLTTLIAIPSSFVAMATTVAGYFHKASKENCVGGIIYDSALGGNNTTEADNEEQQGEISNG